ncbi:MAG: hypothetical protein ND895_22870, partial [Pyrinomonadaceae bacterium]|nr:hypothetical protein [Pyrinomonadaceae bacterium]
KRGTPTMRSRSLQRIALVAIFLAVLQTQSALATTIDPLIWEQLVLDSEFVGIAECEWAGGIVARYRVLESWQGMPVGTHFTLRVATNYWGPQFPVTFVGEKYLITAYKSPAPMRMISTTSGNPVPLWWRNLPAEYHLPLWQGRVRLPLAETKNPLDPLGSEHPDLNSFKKAVDELLSLNPEGREIRLLQALAKKYLFSRLDQDQSPEHKAVSQRLKLAQQKIQTSSSPREIVSELLSAGRSYPEDLRYSIGTILSDGGGAVTLQMLKSNSFNATLWEDQHYQRILAELEQRLGLSDAPKRAVESSAQGKAKAQSPITDVPDEQPPNEERLSQLRKVLSNGPTSNQFGEAFDLLTRYDPGAVAEYLIKWTNPQKDWWDTDYGYIIGSYFASRCGKDRVVHLQTLFRAQDPFIRVAGSVYLTFENPQMGMARLEELMTLPGDPGVWAALNLARRGQKAAVPRALEVFATSGSRGHMSGVPHQNLQLRLMVLLSNSAAASKLPQPIPPVEPGYDVDADTWKKHQESSYRYYAEWWQANQSKIQLSDPWLKSLEQQKID